MPPERQGSGTNRRSFIKALVASGGVALAGCGEDADPVFADGEDEDAGDTPTGGTLDVASADDPENLDPHTTTINVAQLALENVVEGLFDLNEELEIEPLLASDYEVSDDNLVYDIELKEGIQFHDLALLAATRLDGVPNTIPSATGANEPVVMGDVSDP